MPKAKKTWIVVADAAQARVFATSRAGALRQVVDLRNTGLHRHARDAGTDRPGRSIDSAGAARRAEEPRVICTARRRSVSPLRSVSVWRPVRARIGLTI